MKKSNSETPLWVRLVMITFNVVIMLWIYNHTVAGYLAEANNWAQAVGYFGAYELASFITAGVVILVAAMMVAVLD